jgi:hypothetical protein
MSWGTTAMCPQGACSSGAMIAAGSSFGTLGINYNGAFQTHELMPEKKFMKFIDEIA